MAKRSLFGDSQDDNSASEIRPLSELSPGDQADCFALLSEKQRAETRDGKPYYRCQFRDMNRRVSSMIWNDSSWFEVCEEQWQPGDYFRIRCRYQENRYGPQIDIMQIRPVNDEDRELGFDPGDFLPQSRFDTAGMYDELCGIVRDNINDEPLRQLVLTILDDNREQVCEFPAASRNHHAYRSGFLEHVLSVTKTALYLADKYREYYATLDPPLSKDLTIAGAVLHDIGKMQELSAQPHGADYTASGRLIGHILLGRDIVRDYARDVEGLDPEVQLRLEHIIVSHQNLPEWGSPIAPHTPEALLVHYADDIDAKFQMMAFALGESMTDDAEFTSRNNPLRRSIFRGRGEATSAE
ncbi:HD domain-containing protein [bacterium]|nr:HD domain-containing protein [bacterium]